MSSIIITHPSADQYGSDLQLLETVSAFAQAGHAVSVLLPASGPLVPMLEARGAAVRFVDAPILRKNLLSPAGLIKLMWFTLRTAPGMWRELRSDRHTTGSTPSRPPVGSCWVVWRVYARSRTCMRLRAMGRSGRDWG